MLDERQGEFAVQAAGHDFEPHLHGHVLEIFWDLEVRDVEVDGGFQRVNEWLGLPAQPDGRSIHVRVEGGLDVLIHVVGQVGDKWNGEGDILHDMTRVLGAVVEIDAACFDLNIVQRKSKGLRRILGIRRGLRCEFLQQIGKVIGLVLIANDGQIGRLHADIFEDGAAFDHRRGLKIEEQLLE